jgi:hypothetical protein
MLATHEEFARRLAALEKNVGSHAVLIAKILDQSKIKNRKSQIKNRSYATAAHHAARKNSWAIRPLIPLSTPPATRAKNDEFALWFHLLEEIMGVTLIRR